MTLLIDTHLLLWAAGQPQKLSRVARRLLDAPDARPWFSAVSLWEVAIKHSLGRKDFRVEPYGFDADCSTMAGANWWFRARMRSPPSTSRLYTRTRSTACCSRRPESKN
jgi:hypothetical protein